MEGKTMKTELVNRYEVEVTDTFGGEANYCWVKRFKLTLPLARAEGAKARKAYDHSIVRAAKAAAGWTGLRCSTWAQGDGFELRPIGRNAPCWVMFINYVDEFAE
jgi:hypothetical protein